MIQEAQNNAICFPEVVKSNENNCNCKNVIAKCLGCEFKQSEIRNLTPELENYQQDDF